MRLGVFAALAAIGLSTSAQAQDGGTACVQSGPPPPYTGPYTSVAELCARAPRGTEAKGMVPPVGVEPLEAYPQKLQQFLVTDREYQTLGWLGDAHWRLTGNYQGCPPDGNSYGVHPAVRIYYSPEVVKWLCDGRKGELKDGAMVVKEMASITQLIVDPETQQMSVPQTTVPDSWTVMVKNKAGSADGWYWGFFWAAPGNPPIVNRSAAVDAGFPADPPKLDPSWLPTGNSTNPTVVYPNYQYGNYCFNCHASAAQESTFSSLDNVIGKELLYKWLGPLPPAKPRHVGLEGGLRFFVKKRSLRSQQGPFPPARERASPLFLDTFQQLKDPPFSEVWRTRFPAQTYDHVPSGPKPKGPAEFITSDQCQPCHDATQSNASTPNMVFMRKDGTQVNLSPFGEWSASPMGLAGRDPIFLSQLESENNLATAEGLGSKLGCVESLCLHCHGAMGQRQLAQDTGGTGPAAGLCKDFVAPDSRKASSGGTGMRRSQLAAWRDEDPQSARYGALARDGISCTVCHHIASQELGTPSTFTGNFYTVPPAQLNGPYNDPLPKPMENALGITPKGAPQMKSSELCSTCHAVNLPVLDGKGKIVGFSYEQATSLEWQNSAFAGPSGQSCQDCHMKTEYGGRPLAYKIANIEDSSFAPTTDRLPDADLALKPRAPFARHTLYGLNVFLGAFFEQFPLELGYRQLDFMNGEPVPPLVTGRQSALLQAQVTAGLTIDEVSQTSAGIHARVTIQNLTGHNFPSGVGFRRAFLEVQVLGADGKPLWASGRTSPVGVILNGVTDQPLPSEFFQVGPDGKQAFEDHHQVIRSGDQAQIYEELVQDSDRKFTTSFLHRRYLDVKDNRLRPSGWRRDGPFAEVTKPEGKATLADPSYSGKVLTGSDQVDYEISLPPDQLAKARKLTVTLYYQATPPYYLAQRFESAAKGPLKDDTSRLYYLAAHLNTEARAEDGAKYLEGWKLQLAQESEPLGP